MAKSIGYKSNNYRDEVEADIVIPNDETPDELTAAIDYSYMPAANFADAPETVTLVEIWQQVKGQLPDYIKIDILPKALTRMGFVNKNFSGVILYAVKPV